MKLKTLVFTATLTAALPTLASAIIYKDLSDLRRTQNGVSLTEPE